MGILKDRVDIVNQNTKTIKSLGGCADTNSSVSDLLLRVVHYTKKHKKGEEHMFCPECVEGKASIAEKYFFESKQQVHYMVIIDGILCLFEVPRL